MPWMTIPIALGIAGAGSAAAQVYATKRAGDTNNRTIAAQEREATSARDLAREDREATLAFEREQAARAEAAALRDEQLKREEIARRERAYNDAMANYRQQYADYLRINEPRWAFGAQLLQSLPALASYRGNGRPYGGVPTGATAVAGAPPPTAPVVNLTPGDETWRPLSTPSGRITPRPVRRSPIIPMAQAPASGMSLADLMAMNDMAKDYA